MTGEWIVRLAEDERRRDDARLKLTEAASRKANLVALHGQRLLDELRTVVVRDIEAFGREFPGDTSREIVFESAGSDGGFVVRKPAPPTVALSVEPRLMAATMRCHYRFTPTNGMPDREDRVDFTFNGAGGAVGPVGDDTLLIKHAGTGQLFTNADALSEYLLVPVLTGRPR